MILALTFMMVYGLHINLYANTANVELEEYELPNLSDTSFKGYMDYRTITDKKSDQWKLQEVANTNQDGLRVINDMYLVALGTYYTDKCGDVFKVTLEDDNEFLVMVGDIKNPVHTDENNQYVPMSNDCGNVIEFIIDIKTLPRTSKLMGTVCGLGLEGNIIKIEKVVDYNYFYEESSNYKWSADQWEGHFV